MAKNRRKKIGLLSPSYRRDPGQDRAFAIWKDREGTVRRRTFPGGYDTAESRAAFEQLRAEVRASATGRPPKRVETLASVFTAYLAYARGYYGTPDGKVSSTVSHIATTAKALIALYPQKLADKFEPAHLRDALQSWAEQRLKRSQINRRLTITKRCFRWAAIDKLVSAPVAAGLLLVQGLRCGRSKATETEPVRPVADAVVEATLPHLGRHVRAMVELQRATGMRPGEVVRLRGQDLDTSYVDPETGRPVWHYRPPAHKTAHLGRSRVVPIGPRGQEVLRPFLTSGPSAFLFSPAAAMAELRAQRSAARVTPLWPSHRRRNRTKRKRRPQRAPGRRFTRDAYTRAIARACERAFPPPAPLAKLPTETHTQHEARLTPEQKQELAAHTRRHSWHPHQLRHSLATEVRRRGYGLDAVQVILGHANADVTQVYAEVDLTLASRVAAQIG
ncbi:MAG: tyrosine-type recombinase/integrase [Gemmataceae bacterium]|nr:tyrosine-type recombinase/integrase [Gemmataceae bacterium]